MSKIGYWKKIWKWQWSAKDSSSHNPKNRTDNLVGLKTLLEKIVTEYPEAEFISSPELFAIMESESKWVKSIAVD